MLVRIHHVVMDGLSAARLLDRICDGPDGAAPVDPEGMRSHAGSRHDLALVAGGAVHFLSRPLTVARLLPETLAIPVRLAGGAVAGLFRRSPRRAAGAPGTRALPFTAPRTPFNAAITPSRAVGTIALDFHDVTVVRRAFDATVNEVLLAVSGGGLRDYLQRVDALPEAPLISVVPVAIRDTGGHSAPQNKVSARLAGLATDIADPAERLRAIRAARPAAADPSRRPVARASLLADWMELGIGPVLNAGMRVYGGWGLADVGPVVHNLVISNVPGPPERRSLAGAAVSGFVPLAPVYPGAGLSLAAVSYAGRLHVGVLACRHLVPDPQVVADGIGRAMAELVAAVP